MSFVVAVVEFVVFVVVDVILCVVMRFVSWSWSVVVQVIGGHKWWSYPSSRLLARGQSMRRKPWAWPSDPTHPEVRPDPGFRP